jgi:hypothetical protein
MLVSGVAGSGPITFPMRSSLSSPLPQKKLWHMGSKEPHRKPRPRKPRFVLLRIGLMFRSSDGCVCFTNTKFSPVPFPLFFLRLLPNQLLRELVEPTLLPSTLLLLRKDRTFVKTLLPRLLFDFIEELEHTLPPLLMILSFLDVECDLLELRDLLNLQTMPSGPLGAASLPLSWLPGFKCEVETDRRPSTLLLLRSFRLLLSSRFLTANSACFRVLCLGGSGTLLAGETLNLIT